MQQFNLSGDVGWDITPAAINDFLTNAAGDDVKFLVSSRGGLVGDGLEIFNAIRNYPGHVTAVLTGYAMSMASYIPLAADKIIAEDNAVFMIHNVHGGVWGDHNSILKYGNYTAALSKLLAGAYVRHTGKPLAEIQKLMDDETFYYGAEIVDEGFAHEVAETDTDDTRENCLVAARTAYQDCCRKMAQDTRAAAEDLTRAMAVASFDKEFAGRLAAVPKTHNKPETQTEEHNMDLQELKLKHPDLVAALQDETISGIDLGALTASNKSLVDVIAKQGAAQELARIQAVQDQLIPGHEDLITALMWDGATTGEQAAVKVLAAEKTLRADHLDNMQGEAKPAASPDDGGTQPGKPSNNAPVEDRCKAEWDKDQDLRNEFSDFDAFLAYTKASEAGHARQLKQ